MPLTKYGWKGWGPRVVTRSQKENHVEEPCGDGMVTFHKRIQPTEVLLWGGSPSNKYPGLILLPSCSLLLVHLIAEPQQKPESVGVGWYGSYSSVCMGMDSEKGRGKGRSEEAKERYKHWVLWTLVTGCLLWTAVAWRSLRPRNPWSTWGNARILL